MISAFAWREVYKEAIKIHRPSDYVSNVPSAGAVKRYQDFLTSSCTPGCTRAFPTLQAPSPSNDDSVNTGEPEASALAEFLFVRSTTTAIRCSIVGHTTSMIFAMSHEMMMVVLPQITRLVGGDIVTFANLRVLSHSVNLIGGIIVGTISDRTGPKFGLVLSHFSAAAAFLLIGLAPTTNILYLAMLPKAAMHVYQVTIHVMTVHSSEDHRASAIGRVGFLYGLAFFGGSVCLLGILRILGPREVALVAASLEMLSCGIVLLLYPSDSMGSLPSTPAADAPWHLAVPQMLGRPGVVPILGFKLAISIAAGSVLFMAQQFAMEPFGFSAGESALLMSYIGGLQMLSQALVSDQISPQWLYLLSFLGVGASLLGLAMSPPTPQAFVLWLAPLSISYHAANVMLGSLLTLYVPTEEIGGVVGLGVATMSVGQIVAAPFAARIYQHFGFSAVPSVAGAVFLVKSAAFYFSGAVPSWNEVTREGVEEEHVKDDAAFENEAHFIAK